jgi:hypothetical protein
MNKLSPSLRLMAERLGRIFTRSIFPEGSPGLENLAPIPTRSVSQREQRASQTFLREMPRMGARYRHDHVPVEWPLTRWCRALISRHAGRGESGSTTGR